MSESLASNRRIAGTLLAIRNSAPGDYDFDALFGPPMREFLATPTSSAFAILLTAQMVGEEGRTKWGGTRKIGRHEFIGLNLPPEADDNPDIRAAFRIIAAVMNRDLAGAIALTNVATEERDRATNVLACLLGMLTSVEPAEAE